MWQETIEAIVFHDFALKFIFESEIRGERESKGRRERRREGEEERKRESMSTTPAPYCVYGFLLAMVAFLATTFFKI